MTTSFAHIPLEQLHAHPKNPRHDATADEEMVASIKAVGILQALTVAPSVDFPGEFTTIGGHCRKDAAKQAGLAVAPCVIRTDLVTEAQQLEAMMVENGRRRDLTADEEGEGYLQLELFGYKAKDIAKATGRSIGTVRSRLKVARLPEKSRAALHDGEMTLADAEALTEFADDPEQMAKLEEHLGTSNFRYQLQRAKDEVARRARWRDMVKDFEAQGATRLDWPGRWDSSNGPCPIGWTVAQGNEDQPEVHKAAGCLAWTHSGESYSDPALVCTQPSNHASAKKSAAPASGRTADDEAKFEAERAEREEQRALKLAAARVRIDYMVEHFTSLLTAAKLPTALAESLRVTLPVVLRAADSFDTDAYMHAMGLEGPWWTVSEAHALGVGVASTPKVLKVQAALHAATAEALLSDPRDEQAAQAWTWLLATGYQPSDIDTELHKAAMEDQEGAA